jgi:hypothetical protein
MFALLAGYPWLVIVALVMSCALIFQVRRPCMIFPPATAAVTVRSFLRALPRLTAASVARAGCVVEQGVEGAVAVCVQGCVGGDQGVSGAHPGPVPSPPHLQPALHQAHPGHHCTPDCG